MLFGSFVVIVILWIIVAALYNLVASGSTAGRSRGETGVLRTLIALRASLALVYWTLTVVVLADAGRQFGFYGIIWPMLFILGVAALVYYVVNQPPLQRYILKFVVHLNTKWGAQLGFIPAVLRAIHPFAKKMFRQSPLYRNREGLLNLVRREHQMHRSLSPSQHRQLENLLKAESETIAKHIIPLKEAAMVKADDTVGPLLLTDLHDSPRAAFAVYSKRRVNIVGILEQGVAVSHAKGTSKVSGLMDERIVFLPQNATLAQALQTFTETSSALSVIIDENNTPTGVLYIQDIVRELFGDFEEQSNENTHQPAR